jgi:hypothetical protein
VRVAESLLVIRALYPIPHLDRNELHPLDSVGWRAGPGRVALRYASLTRRAPRRRVGSEPVAPVREPASYNISQAAALLGVSWMSTWRWIRASSWTTCSGRYGAGAMVVVSAPV